MRKFGRKKNSFSELFAAFCSGAVIIGVLWLWYESKANGIINPPAGSSENTSVITTSSQSTQQSQQTGVASDHSSEHEMMVVSQEVGSIPAKERVKYKIDRFKKLALQPLEFEVFDEQNKALKPEDLKTVHEQLLHFIVVSADYKEYQHLHPSFEQGKWKTLAYLPTPGTYYAYVDISPLQGNPVVLRSDLIVREPTQNTIAYPPLTKPDASGKFAIINGPYQAQVSLMRPHLLQQTLFSYELSVVEPRSISSLESYLGALGHAVVLKQGEPDVFLHLHPLSGDAQKGQAQFVTTFNKPGKYTVFAEFRIVGKIYAFSTSFEIT